MFEMGSDGAEVERLKEINRRLSEETNRLNKIINDQRELVTRAGAAIDEASEEIILLRDLVKAYRSLDRVTASMLHWVPATPALKEVLEALKVVKSAEVAYAAAHEEEKG